MNNKENTPIINVKDLGFKYGNKNILSNISFKITKGEYIGLIGKNGSGKTTLLKALLGLIPISSGTIDYFGNSNGTEIPYDKIGYTPQLHSIQRDFPASVGDIVEMGLYRKNGLFKKAHKDNIHKVLFALHQVGMERFINRPIGHLSGGEQQKVMIAQALVKEPDILIMDEPTSAFDYITIKSFLELLNNLNKNLGIAILVIQHNLDLLRPYCSRLLMLSNTIVYDGTPNDPKVDNILPKIFEYQSEVF